MNIREIAKLAGVSASTVSKIINNKDTGINAETRNHVLKIVKEYNYIPYGTAQKQSDARTFTLGVLLPSELKSHEFLQGILSEAQQNGYCVQIYGCESDPERELKNIASLCSHRIDGVIWEPVSVSSLEQKYQFDRQDVKSIVIGPSSGLCIDFEYMGYEAAGTLLKNGHANIGFLSPGSDIRCESMLSGIKKCLFENNIPYREDMLLSFSDTQWLPRLLSHSLTGIIIPYYSMALWLTERLSSMHLHIPQDVSLITLADDSNSQLPILSSFTVPHRDFGSYICRLLIQQCENQPASNYHFGTICRLNHSRSLAPPPSALSKKIIVVGSINIDVTLNVDQLPQAGRTVITDKRSVVLGGKGSNQAVGAARLGAQAILVGKVGDDYSSTLVYSCMAENHVNADGIRREPHFQTGKAYIHVQNDGESTITILTGANQSLSPRDIASYDSLFDQASFCLLQTEVPVDAVAAAALAAKKHGAKTILKPAAVDWLPDSLMKCIDIFVPNHKEAELLCPEYPGTEEKAREFARRGADSVIITLGHRGCYIYSKDYCGYIPPADFTPVDTTGAADAFICALAVYMSDGYPIDRAAKIASCAAGFCVSRQGVIPALIDKNSLETYIQATVPGLL